MSRADFARRSPHRQIRSKVVIACEGKKTEPLYFDAIRSHLRASAKDIVIVDHKGTDPLTIVQSAVDEVERQKPWLKGDTAWAVFDGDEHRQNAAQKQNWDQALALAAAMHITVVISNPCFELWYLLHFQLQNANIHRDAALSALKTHIHGYDKGISVFAALHALQPPLGRSSAASRAAGLRAMHDRNSAHPWTNPSTDVHILVGRLLG